MVFRARLRSFVLFALCATASPATLALQGASGDERITFGPAETVQIRRVNDTLIIDAPTAFAGDVTTPNASLEAVYRAYHELLERVQNLEDQLVLSVGDDLGPLVRK